MQEKTLNHNNARSSKPHSCYQPIGLGIHRASWDGARNPAVPFFTMQGQVKWWSKNPDNSDAPPGKKINYTFDQIDFENDLIPVVNNNVLVTSRGHIAILESGGYNMSEKNILGLRGGAETPDDNTPVNCNAYGTGALSKKRKTSQNEESPNLVR